MKLQPFLSMSASIAVPMMLLTACSSSASVDPALPAWSKLQIDSLRKWATSAAEDALPQFGTGQLDRALDSGDETAIRQAALTLAEQLAKAHLRGCAGPEERAEWFMTDDGDGANLRGRLSDALLSGETLDGFFAGMRPAHPEYAALRQAYLAETDPGRRLTIARNMERWRWMPQMLGADYVLVNVPAFEVYLWRQGAAAQTWRAVVGKTATPTPQLAATITAITFNPWWDVPPSIVQAGGHFSGRRGYITTKGGHVRQQPGPGNALGQMKVEMPNPYAIYLHDTPSKGLFGAATRAFSHGCVRVADPLSLAAHLLEGVRTRSDIDALLRVRTRDEAHGRISRPPALPEASGSPTVKTSTVKLRADLPVYIAYFTAAPRPDGSLGFLPDIYGRDSLIFDPARPGKACSGAAAQPPAVPKTATNGSQSDPGP